MVFMDRELWFERALNLLPFMCACVQFLKALSIITISKCKREKNLVLGTFSMVWLNFWTSMPWDTQRETFNGTFERRTCETIFFS